MNKQQKNLSIPERWNGVKTDYELFDGYREATSIGKVFYLASILFSGPIMPILIEYLQNVESGQAAKAAREGDIDYHPRVNFLHKPFNEPMHEATRDHVLQMDAPFKSDISTPPASEKSQPCVRCDHAQRIDEQREQAERDVAQGAVR